MATDNEVMECTPECNMNYNMGIDNDDAIIEEQFVDLNSSIVSIKSALNNYNKTSKLLKEM